MSSRMKVMALGSCRIVNPLRLASQAGSVSLVNADTFGYVHTAREVLQCLDCMEGRMAPESLLPYLACSRTKALPSTLTEPDAFLVEISSLKQVVFREWVLQLNYFSDRLRAHADLHETFRALSSADQRNLRTLALLRQPDFPALPAGDRHVLVDAYLTTVLQAELERNILSIAARLPQPALFVTHCNIPSAGGRLIESRALIAEWLGAIGRKHGIAVFDPSSLVLEFGIANAMSEEGRSLAHYSDKFQAHLSEQLVTMLQQVAAAPTGRVMPEPTSFVDPASLVDMPVLDVRTHATRLLRSGDTEGAAAMARTAIADQPPHAEAITVLAQASFQEGSVQEALAFALQAREADPGSLAVVVTAAKAQAKLRNFQEAAELWREASALRPRAVWPLVEAARCELEAARPEAVLEMANAALAQDPQEALALALKAEALQHLGRLAELPDVGKSLAAAVPEASLSIIQLMLSAGHLSGLTHIAGAIRERASVLPAHSLHDAAQALREAADRAREKDDWEGVGEALRAALLLLPSDKRLSRELAKLAMDWIGSARTALREHDLAAAASAYDMALRVDPTHRRALREAASTAEKMSLWGRAAELWGQVCRNEAVDCATLRRAARAAEMSGLKEEALAFYQRILAINPSDRKAALSFASLIRRLAKRARALEEAGDLDEAVRLAMLVIAFSPSNMICTRILKRAEASLAGRLRAAVLTGSAQEQEHLAQALLAIAPNRPEALKILSQARLASGCLEDAARLLHRLASTQSGVVAHWVKLGRCLRMMKNFDDARDAAMRALSIQPDSPAALKILADIGQRAPA